MHSQSLTMHDSNVVQSNRKMNFRLKLFSPSPSSSQSFRFLERQFSTTIRGTRSPWTPKNKWGRNPPNPPARLSSLRYSRLLSLTDPGRRLQAPHHINHSALTCLSSCTSRQTQLHFFFMLLRPGVKWDVCKNTARLRNALVSVHMWPVMIWFQSEVRFTLLDNRYVYAQYLRF